MRKNTIKSRSAQETAKLGSKTARKLAGKSVIALYGDLGAGKTVFVKGLAKGLGIKKTVTSPTFVLCASYRFWHKNQNWNLWHWDLYRLKNGSDALAAGLTEHFQDPRAVVVIEWPEKIKKLLPPNHLKIIFRHEKENRRLIQFG